jgi:hypothetical protein
VSGQRDALWDPAAPIASLIAKSEKARHKLAPGTWQHAMLSDNLDALRIATTLMSGDMNVRNGITPEALRHALRAFASMVVKTERAAAKSKPGTAQHTLLANRLHALGLAEALIAETLDERHT